MKHVMLNSPRLYIVYERLKVCFCQYMYGTADMARSCLPKEECFFTLTSVDCLDLAVWVTHVSRILKAGIASFQISNFQLDQMHHSIQCDQCDGVNSGPLGLQVRVEVGLLGVRALVPEKSWEKTPKPNKKTHFNTFWYTMVTVKVEDGHVWDASKVEVV